MAEEENNDIVTYIVKIKVTLSVPDSEEPITNDDDRETLPTFNILSLKLIDIYRHNVIYHHNINLFEQKTILFFRVVILFC